MTKNRRMKQNPQKGKRMAVNVREIAKKANVSAATVSRVLHQSEQVKPETRKKVEEAMRQLQVTAGELVRSARMDTRIVGILVPDLSNSFFFRVHFGNRRICQGSGTDYHYLPYEGVRPGRSEVSSDVKGNACMRDHYDSHIR